MDRDSCQQLQITPWKTDLSGALVEYRPSNIWNHHLRAGLPIGAKGIVLEWDWVNNTSVGQTACFYRVLWAEHGYSHDIKNLAHFLNRDIKVIALAEVRDESR